MNITREILAEEKARAAIAKASLIQRGLLNKAGAITDSGRNAIGRTDLYSLKA